MKIKTIDIQGKIWFDRINGNSYNSARITINFGLPDAVTLVSPFEYGYGSMYEQLSFDVLRKAGYLKDTDKPYNLRDRKIVLRSSCIDNCLKRDVIAWGKL